MEARHGLLNANQIEVTYYNWGEFGDWMNQPVQSFNWPTGSGHLYLAGSAFIVQARAVTKTGKVIHPLETNYFEYTRRDPFTGVTYGWWPVPGYARPWQAGVAQSNKPSTWPDHWPDKPGTWDGSWNGYLGKGVTPFLSEAYCVMDDDLDRQYIADFHPDSSDTTRGGLGLRIRMRALEWDVPQARDMLFLSFVVSNEGTTVYDSTFVAEYMDYAVGGYDNGANNEASFSPAEQLFMARSTVPYGQPGNWTPVGLLGVAALATPDSLGLTGVLVCANHTYDLNNDERNWTAIHGPGVNIQSTQNLNAVGFLSSGPFRLAPGEEKQVMFVYLFADDTTALKAKAAFARRFYQSGFDTRLLQVRQADRELPAAFSLEQNYPNPFNPVTTIRYCLPRQAYVTLQVFNSLGQKVAELVSGERDPGTHEVRFDAGSLASGVYFYRLSAVPAGAATARVDTKSLLLIR